MILIMAVFLASLLGSLHCAGMCGAFMLFAVGADPAAPRGGHARLHAAYHGGRLIIYVTLGIIAGAVGAAFDLGGSMLGVQRIAAACAGLLMVGFGVMTLLRIRGVRIRLDPIPRRFRTLIESAQQRAFELPPTTRALTVGLMTTLLPCGWLYAFVFTSAGTGHPGLGGVSMAAFWAGTLPVMASLGVGLQALTGPLRRRLPLLTSISLVAIGLYMVVARVSVPVMSRETLGIAPASLEGATPAIPRAEDVDCPLCDPVDG